MQRDELRDKVYTCAFNYRTSLNGHYQMMCDRLVDRVNGLPFYQSTYRDFWLGDVRHSQANITKASELLGYYPSHKIADGLNEAMDWYVSSLGVK